MPDTVLMCHAPSLVTKFALFDRYTGLSGRFAGVLWGMCCMCCMCCMGFKCTTKKNCGCNPPYMTCPCHLGPKMVMSVFAAIYSGGIFGPNFADQWWRIDQCWRIDWEEYKITIEC